jgi:mono/diheme cytochrome c family protein
MSNRLTPFRLGAVAATSAAGILLALVLAAPGTGAQSARSDTGSSTLQSASPGKRVYDAHCVECHGRDGRGDGPAASTLVPRPRDFTSGRYKIRSTETGSLPTDEDLARTIRRGMAGSSMPDWDGILTELEIRDVVSYVKTLSPRFAREAPEPVSTGGTAAVESSAASVSRGADVYHTLQCGKCHGEDGRGTGATTTTFEDDWGFPMRAANLSEPWTFRGGAAPADIFMRFRAGMSGTPMPSYTGSATDSEMWDLANYVASLRRKPLWEMDADEVTRFYAQRDAEMAADQVGRGEHLIDTLGCALCHTPNDEERRPIPGLYLAGGLRIKAQPFGTFTSGNLTSDAETGLGDWTTDEIRRAITKGIRKDGSRMLPFPMDWASYSTMSEADVNAIVVYLRSIPPVYNRIPPPRRTWLPAHLWGKFQMLALGRDLPSFLLAGNAGTTRGDQR